MYSHLGASSSGGFFENAEEASAMAKIGDKTVAKAMWLDDMADAGIGIVPE
jgi:hypothetical protein